MRVLLLLLCAVLSADAAQKSGFVMRNAAGEAPGPWLFGTIGVGKGPDGKPLTTALKGLALKLGPNGEAGIAYDLDLCRVAGAWTGGKFVTPMNLMSRGEYPTALGTPVFILPETAGFQETNEPWRDRRSEPFGPIAGARYAGMYLHGNTVILKWRIGETEVLERPDYTRRGDYDEFQRNFTIAPRNTPLRILVGDWKSGATQGLSQHVVTSDGAVHPVRLSTAEDAPEYVEIPAHDNPYSIRVVVLSAPHKFDPGPEIAGEGSAADLSLLTKGGPARWSETLTLTGQPATDSAEPYVVDAIPVPDENPWGSPMFIGGFDFFPDGRAAVCTFHGDVFIVSGLDRDLGAVTWKRYAGGLYHALGLKIVDGEIYVTGRDGITRLRDLNGDGEADFYEAFNWDVKVTKSFHEFCFDLQTDSQGNFLFAKAGPVKNGGRGFDQICEHHGCLLQVSRDGKNLKVLATGFRAPNGLGTGPHGEITSGDNEGTWTPVCKINWINPGGFYGVVDLAHWPQPPQEYDRPICWLPKRFDNSSGGQVWATSGKWGPWDGHLLHLSYGQCALYGVMMEDVEVPDQPDCCSHPMQGGVVKFPLKFQSGIMRARFDPVDGQLYVAGLRGWQTTAVKNGCFQRVRYTGAPARMPIALSAKKNGIELKFTCSLDTQAAADPENWSVEVWNYLWSSAYGSPELSTVAPAEKPAEAGKSGELEFTRAQMSKAKHDPLTVKSVSIGTDDRTVFLEIPGMKPVMQMSIKYQLRRANGRDLDGEVVNTVHGFAP